MRYEDRWVVRSANVVLELSDGFRDLELCGDILAGIAAIRKVQPMVIAVGGIVGAGKSTLAMKLAEQIGAIRIRMDAVRKHLFGTSLDEKLPEEFYTPHYGRLTQDGLVARIEVVIRAGVPAIADGTFLHPPRREQLVEVARKLEVPFAGIWCEADPILLRQRVRDRRSDVSDADLEVLERLLPMNISAPAFWTRINTNKRPKALVKRLFPVFRGYRLKKDLPGC